MYQPESGLSFGAKVGVAIAIFIVLPTVIILILYAAGVFNKSQPPPPPGVPGTPTNLPDAGMVYITNPVVEKGPSGTVTGIQYSISKTCNFGCTQTVILNMTYSDGSTDRTTQDVTNVRDFATYSFTSGTRIPRMVSLTGYSTKSGSRGPRGPPATVVISQ